MSKVQQGGILYINGLPVAHAGSGGHASTQEECWVTIAGQKVKKPFTNLAYSRDLKNTAQLANSEGYPIATQDSFTSKSYGDAETEGGVKTNTKEGKLSFLSGSPNVFFEGQPAVRHGDVVISNAGNTELSTWVQPSKSTPAVMNLESDPIDSVVELKAVNIQLLRHPAHQFDAPSIHQYFLVEQDQTKHKTYHTFGVFKQHEDKFLWHGDFFSSGTYTAYEVFADRGDWIMQVPLGKIKAVDKNNTEPGLKLVPLSFKRFDGIDNKVEEAEKTYPRSYIYLFKDGYLWREFEVNFLDRLNEVNLVRYQDKHERPASAELKQGILLPVEDAEGKHNFHIAVSRVRWSWEYIYQMGGIDPKDLRLRPEHRLSIAPDRELIKQRLQPIDIHSLLSGQTCKDLYWHTEVPTAQSLTPTLDSLRPESKNKTRVAGAAILVLEDPLGRLIETSDTLVTRHFEYQEMMSQEGEISILAKMVGELRPVVDEEDYLDNIREDERATHLWQFEAKVESYKRVMAEGMPQLKHWFEASHERGQWKDFEHAPDDEFVLSMTSDIYDAIHRNISAAFHLSPEGAAYLQEEVKRSTSHIINGSDLVKRWSQKTELSLRHITDTANVLASSLNPDNESLEKILNFLEETLDVKFNARLDDVPLDDLLEWHQTSEPPAPHSGIYRIAGGHISRHIVETRTSNQVRTVSMLIIEEVPLAQLHALSGNKMASPVPQHVERVHQVATRINVSPKVKAALGVLTLFNTRHLTSQIDSLQGSGDLEAGTLNVLHMEVYRNIALVTALSVETGLMTNQIADRRVSNFVKRLAKRANSASIFIGVIVDWMYIHTYYRTGESVLIMAHTMNIISAGIAFYLTFTIQITMFITALGLIGLALGIIAAILILLFTKNEVERWLFDGYWGKSEAKKDTISHSIEKFHRLVTVVRLEQFNHRNDKFWFAERKHTRGFNSTIGPCLPPNEFVFQLYAPAPGELLLKIHLWVQRGQDLLCLDESSLLKEEIEAPEGGTRWNIRVKEYYFAKTGYLGCLKLECFEAKTKMLVGKDAYTLHHHEMSNSYLFEKVLYDPIK